MDLKDALSPEHYEEIVLGSSIDPPVAAARGYRTLTGTGTDRDELSSLGFKPYVWSRDNAYPGLLIPMHGADGTVRGHQFKPAVPRTRPKTDGTLAPIKYETPAKAPLVVDVPEFTRQALGDVNTPLWITEGMKKTDALVSQGLAAVGLTGVFNWRNAMGTLGDWEDIPLKGRPAVICFDSDAAGNRNVQLAMGRLGAWLRSRGASAVHYLVVPPRVGETDVKGVDDYFAAGGDLGGLHAAATQTAPGAGEKDAAFTDAFLVEELAEAMTDRFCWAAGLGWLRWNGRVWKEVSDVEPLEAVRVWASEQFDKVLTQQRQDVSKNMAAQIAGWRAILGKSRLTALRDLLRGLIQRDSAEFDGDPDLLTVLNGTLHLPSGRLLPFDPAHYITKSADAEYRQGFTHPLWTKALRAIPEDMHAWYQDRLGQSLTGYPVPDHTLVIAHGSGSNGKSTIVATVRRTLGEYGVMISDRVLMASPDAHPTELMDLRGARYAVMEETPEARHLNVQRLKTVLGTDTIKARRIRQDPVEFLASHSLFINTNYRPVVTETDWGTWRRLSLMPFPFTFKKAGQPLDNVWDREGDPTLAYAANDSEVRSAALAWMAEGARGWYARGRMMLETPPRVEKETRDWRSETDLILGFADECLRFTPDGFVQTQEMLKVFNDWADGRGHRPWNDRTFATRFGSHDTVRGAKVAQGRFTVKGKQQRGWMGVEISTDGQDPFTGERDVSPAPGGYDPGECTISYDDGGSVVGPQEYPEQEPIFLGFDLETADADELFRGRHEGSFVRLVGSVDDDFDRIGSSTVPLIADLNTADEIYGANILGFDLLALAYHHGADYDALAAKAVDLTVRERLVDPPMSKGGQSYTLDAIAERYGVAGKTDDIKALARKHGGFDRIPLDSREYQDYLRGDLASTKAVKAAQDARVKEMGLEDYAAREMRVAAIQNRVSLNGWKVDTELLAERVRHEAEQRAAAVEILNKEFGVPLAKPDRFKLKPMREWPAVAPEMSHADARAALAANPENLEALGMAVRIPGEVSKKPWTTNEGRDAIVKAFADAGAPHVPRSPGGVLRTSADAMGEAEWYDKDRRENVKGMLQVYGDKPQVRRIVETLMLATGARDKYAEIAGWVTDRGRVHSSVGAAQGSGRWAYTTPSLTNMGKHGAAGQERAIMIADEGHVLLTCDASQVDMRAVAALSQDPAYMALFEPGRDAHMEMAEVYFGARTAEFRQRTKRINHKFNYGGGVDSTSKMEKIPREIVQQAFNARQEAYPVLRDWLQSVRDLAATGALLDNGFGRLMRPDPERAATQGPALMGQGAARDIVCESLLRLVERDARARGYLRGFVHDEVILSVPQEDAGYWAGVLEDAFTWTWRDVPILCEVGKPSLRWSDCK